jgi:hypothetical protein
VYVLELEADLMKRSLDTGACGVFCPFPYISTTFLMLQRRDVENICIETTIQEERLLLVFVFCISQTVSKRFQGMCNNRNRLIFTYLTKMNETI